MATFKLVSVLVHTPPVISDISANDVIDVLWDDSTSAIVTKKNGSSWTGTSSSFFGEINTNYSYLNGITSHEGDNASGIPDYAVSGYSYCSGTDLKWFKMLVQYAPYPYMVQQTTANSPVCDVGGGAVCDIAFVGPFTITHSTDKSTGGSIKFTVTSSNGTVKYSLRNFDFATGGIVASAGENTLSGIIPGNWTLYVKDANDCTAKRTFKILFKPVDSEHYRFTWASKQIGQGTSRDARIRIYEREYAGDVVEVDFADVSPFQLNKPKQGAVNEKFFPIHPTNAVLRLASLEDYQFLPLFTQDNKRYRVVYEVDEGSGFTEVWQGFIDPNVYREDFVAAPYFVEMPVSDNLKILESTDFTDDNGQLLFGDMKLIKVLAFILKKTGLNLKIRSTINIFEENHNTAATDDPLDQTYIDVACYRSGSEPFNCWEVIEAILRPFGAGVKQYRNQWIIEEMDRAVATYAYRVFSSDGEYESNSTFDPVIDVKSPSLTDRAALIESDHSLEVIPAYGKITLTSKLNYVGSIVAGGFEKEDLLSPDSETFNIGQGVYKSEEGFKGWTLRMPNGVSGVSFGRVIVSNRGEDRRIGLEDEDPTRSVGAFYHDPNSWSGNVRDAYIESPAKPYQYGPGDDLRFYFEYSTPARPEYEFMVLRMMIKVGSNYLQPDLTWDTTESVYRSYPKVSNSLQKFELTVPAPDTTEIVDSTIQVRIYFYASTFFDYGLPASTGDADGVDGFSGLDSLPTVGIDYDYRVDVRRAFDIGTFSAFYRDFYELRVMDASDDWSLGAILSGQMRPTGDSDSSTNPKFWWRLKAINIKTEEENTRRRGLDLKFYIDDVALDALVNGQPPPDEDTISLSVSKYINENLEVPLYNFDVPDITNAKNMYNNYFKLSDGTPTSKWSRSGISELLPLRSILLKVLGGNHSAPTFRVTGSFINEFSRIGIDNYIRITKTGSNLSLSNTEFTSNITGWSQSSFPLLSGDWSWTSDNGGSAQVTMSGAEDSKIIYQPVSQHGGYIEVTININVVPTAGNTREDALFLVFYRDGSIIHSDKLRTFAQITSESLSEFTYIAHCPKDVDGVGFFIKAVSGSGTNVYQVGEFSPVGKDIQEVYQIADYISDERLNTYRFELIQMSKTYVSLSGIDTGGNNQSGGSTGRAHSSGYSSAYS